MSDLETTSVARSTTIELRYLHPLQAGKVLGLMYAVAALVFVPFLLLGPLLGGADGVVAVVPIVLMIALYPLMGFIGGVVVAVIYNFIAKQIGGVRIDLR